MSPERARGLAAQLVAALRKASRATDEREMRAQQLGEDVHFGEPGHIERTRRLLADASRREQEALDALVEALRGALELGEDPSAKG